MLVQQVGDVGPGVVEAARRPAVELCLAAGDRSRTVGGDRSQFRFQQRAADLSRRLDEMRADQQRAEAELRSLADRRAASEADWQQRVEAMAGFAEQLRASLAGAPSP